MTKEEGWNVLKEDMHKRGVLLQNETECKHVYEMGFIDGQIEEIKKSNDRLKEAVNA